MKRDKIKAIIKLAYILGRARGMSKNAAKDIVDWDALKNVANQAKKELEKKTVGELVDMAKENAKANWSAIKDVVDQSKKELSKKTVGELVGSAGSKDVSKYKDIPGARLLRDFVDSIKWFTSPEFFKYLFSKRIPDNVIKRDLTPEELAKAFSSILGERGGNKALLDSKNLQDFVESITAKTTSSRGIPREIAKYLPSDASPRLLYKLLRKNVEALRNAIEATEAAKSYPGELKNRISALPKLLPIYATGETTPTPAAPTAKDLSDAYNWFSRPEFFEYLSSRSTERHFTPGEVVRALKSILKERGGNEALLDPEKLDAFVKEIMTTRRSFGSPEFDRLFYKFMRQNVEKLREAISAREQAVNMPDVILNILRDMARKTR